MCKIKKTRTRPSQVERLVKTIQDKTASYGCLLIPRSLDGRMQGKLLKKPKYESGHLRPFSDVC